MSDLSEMIERVRMSICVALKEVFNSQNMSQKEIINLLNDLILQEEKKLSASLPTDSVSRKTVLYSLVRGFDTYHLFTKGNDKYVHHYEFGWMKSLRLAYGDYVKEERYPLFKAEEKLLSFAHLFVIRSGEIEFCRPDPNTFGFRVDIVGELKEKDVTYLKLKWSK